MYILPAQTQNKKKLLILICVQCIVHACVNAYMYVTFKSSCVFRTMEQDTSKNKWAGLFNFSECLCYSLLRNLHPEQL